MSRPGTRDRIYVPAGLLELPCRRAYRRGVYDVEFGADPRHRPLRQPLRRSDARLGAFG